LTREELLLTLEIEDADFRDYLAKIAAFRSSLNPSQLALFKKSMESAEKLAESLGPDVTLEFIEELCAEAPPLDGIACIRFSGPPDPPPPPPPDPDPGS
jgi:hypothetical protein